MVRAKFRVHDKFKTEGEFYNVHIRMSPVYSDDKNSENYSFWSATPAGEISMQINNEEAAKRFNIGDEFYVDFTKCN